MVKTQENWLDRRRMSKDDEELKENSKAMIHITMIQLMLRRIADGTC